MTLVGSETPRIFTPPLRPLTRKTSRGQEAIDFAEQVLGLTLMPWQKWLLLHLLELAEDGSFRFRTALVLTARQQGKSTVLQIVALWRMYVDRAQLVLGSAQTLDLAEEVWDGAVSMAEGVPDLAAEIANVSRVNGDKNLRLIGGERYKITPASRRGGRGLSSDLVLLDELREHHDWDSWSAITKTVMARPSPQILCFSNAGDRRSVVLADLRDKAIAAIDDPSSTIGIFEWSAPDHLSDHDPEAWVAANPSLGWHTPVIAITSALATDPSTVFATEVLCRWVTAIESAIPGGLWDALADPDAPRGSDVIFSLDVAADHSTSSIGVAWQRADGAAHVQLVEHRPGVDWLVPRAAEVTSRWDGRLVVESTGTAAWLVPELEAAGVPLERVSRQFFVQACASLDAAVAARRLRHGNGAALNAAVAAARWSTSGEAGQRVLSRRDPKVSGLVAAALALHGLSLPKASAGGWVMAL